MLSGMWAWRCPNDLLLSPRKMSEPPSKFLTQLILGTAEEGLRSIIPKAFAFLAH
jgi:hypothetical protein